MVGELINHCITDSVAFELPLFYSKQLPDINQGYNDAKSIETSDYDAFAPNTAGLSLPRIQFPLDSKLILSRKIEKRKENTFIKTGII